MKSNSDKSEKYSIVEVEPLIKSILKVYPDLTEEGICLALGYNGGYISQLRSREKTTGEPQVSQKFYNQLQSFSLQKANFKLLEFKPTLADNLSEYEVKEKLSTGKEEYIKALLEEKDKAIKKAEESALKMEAHYEDAKTDKEKLFTQLSKLQASFDETLKQISENLKETAINLTQNRDLLALLKDQTYIVSTQLEHQREALDLGMPGEQKHLAPFVKKGRASTAQQQDGGKKNKGR